MRRALLLLIGLTVGGPASAIVTGDAPIAALSAQSSSTNPHGELPEGLACSDCHTTESWLMRDDADFDHGRFGGFDLTGSHADVTCVGCHERLTFDDLDSGQSDCASCHTDVHQGTIGRPCASCHTTTSFSDLDIGIVHPADFPLEGAHLQTSCESCHTDDLGGAFRALDRECATCHMDEYASAPLIDHVALGFSTDCTECHSTLDFRDVPFDHVQISGGFELVGRHTAIECTACHSGPDGTVPDNPAGPEDCVACHIDDYQDEHGGSGFPTDCTACHNTNDWDDADFDHTTTAGFELIPNHDQLLCIECHVGSTSETIFQPSGPQDCFACHQNDYQDEHAGTGFPTDCLACHESTTWEGATFEHTFLIFSGPHAEEWNDCADCHQVPGDYGIFTCLTCHGRNDMDDKHSEEPGYAYESNTCLSCHPTGRED